MNRSAAFRDGERRSTSHDRKRCQPLSPPATALQDLAEIRAWRVSREASWSAAGEGRGAHAALGPDFRGSMLSVECFLPFNARNSSSPLPYPFPEWRRGRKTINLSRCAFSPDLKSPGLDRSGRGDYISGSSIMR